MKKHTGVAILTSIMLVSLAFSGVAWGRADLEHKARVEFEDDEIIIRIQGDVEPFRVITLPEGVSIRKGIQSYQERFNLEYAEPNYIAHTMMVPNDPYYNYQWHMDNNEYGGIQMEAAWDISTGSGVTVAIIDTGIAYEDYGWYKQAPDLAETCFVPGYDYVNDDSHPNDDNGHGTHVAGTVAQSTNNSLGVTGVAFDACLMPVKVLDKRGSGTYADVASGIYFATDNGAQVINLSLGGSADSLTLKNAVAYAYNHNVTVVAAAGNDGSSILSYPAAYDDYVIAVGATRYDENLAYYSNYGPSLDLVAPGGDLSVDQNEDGYADGVLQQTFSRRPYNFGYYFFQGTSMASPHVAGTAALVIANGNASTPDEVRAALEDSAEDLGTAGRDDIYGYGLVDAAAALVWTSGPVDNPPTVSITSPIDGAVVSGVVAITADASDDVGVVQVDFYYDAILIGTDDTSPYSIDWDSTLVSDGAYALTATAIDTASQTASDSVSVTADNVNDPPVADAGPDQSAYVGDTVYFDGSGSYDPDGSITSFNWDFGDGATGSGETVSHAYAVAGTYTVVLVVIDNGGATGEDSALVEISEKPSQPTMHVGDITFTADVRNRKGTPYCKVTAYVPILDSLAGGVIGAEVFGHWSGAYSRDVSGDTNGEGVARFRTRWVKGCGTFTFAVDDVIKEDWIYDPGANVETSDSVTLP